MSDFASRPIADATMHAWSDTTEAPALALVHDPKRGTYRILEADDDGMLVLWRAEKLVDTIWTPHSAEIDSLVCMNAYSVTCCYDAYYGFDDNILVPHGTEDLTAALHRAIENANDCSDWRSVDAIGDTYIDAIAEGPDVEPWTGDLPVPEDLSKEGPRPIVLIRMAGGRIDDVKLVRGQAHVVVTHRDGEAIDRGPHIHVRDDGGEFLMTNWTGADQFEALPDLLVKELGLRSAPRE